MSFIKNNLKNGENLIFQSSQSIKSLFFWTFIFTISGLADFFIRAGNNLMLQHQIIISLVIFSFIKNLIVYLTTEYGITNSRILSKEGLIRRDIEEMNLNSIESINVNQSILARLLNYGTIVISGRGTSKVIFKDIDKVTEIRKLIKN
jgi:uncharacterized membrane protein YdbT with pleckstrin-like domain